MTPREQLAEMLKQARLEAGYRSQKALAGQLHLSRPVITRAESVSQPVPSEDVLIAWSRVTGIPLDTLEELAKRAKSGTPFWFVPYLGAEQAATMIRCWGPLVVPGLLQTEAYARAVLEVDGYPPEQLDELVATRMSRQGVLDRAGVTAVIDFSVLQRCLGSPEVMAEQCAHLLDVAAARSNVLLHVVPEGTNVGLYGAFDVASKGGLSTVNLTSIRDVSSTEPDLLDETASAWERILGAAMSRRDSHDFAREQEEMWKKRI